MADTDIKISQLSGIQVVNDADVFPIVSGGVTSKVSAETVKEYTIGDTDNSELGDDVSAQIQALASRVAKCEVLIVDIASFSALPQTITNPDIDGDMVELKTVLSNPSAQTSEYWTVATSNGSLTISGSISGTTAATLYLIKSR